MKRRTRLSDVMITVGFLPDSCEPTADPRTTGKQWHAPKKAFRPGSGLTSYEKRAKERVAMAALKAKEKEMKDEKEAERQVCATIGWTTTRAGQRSKQARNIP